jgi:16S rRNA G966 N2-methylase RsmD
MDTSPQCNPNRGAPRSNGTAGLRPFFGFYGGKWRDTPRLYPRPEYDTIVEPFAGSAGYSLRAASRKVILCDKDPVITSVWSYLIGAKAREVLSLPDIESWGSVDELKVCQEAKWLIGFWVNRGVTAPRKRPSKWMRDGIRPGSFWGDRVRKTIASQLDGIRHWKVYNVSYEKCPIDSEATWFVDPPYQSTGEHYRFGSTAIDYDELACWCKDRAGQIIVCENVDAEWLEFRPLHNAKTVRAGRVSNEVIWTHNGVSPAPKLAAAARGDSGCHDESG